MHESSKLHNMPPTIATPQTGLATLLAQAPLPPAQALRQALQYAQALRASNQSSRGDCWGYSPRPTPDAEEADTLRPYTPPEVLAGSAIDVRSDVYTLGAVLYHLLCGQPPCSQAAPPALCSLPGLEAVVRRCLDKDPNRRWQNLQIFSIELRLLCAAAERLSPLSGVRESVETRLQERITSLEAALDARIGVAEQALPALREAVSETRDYVRSTFELVEDRLRFQSAAIDKLQSAAGQADDRFNLQSHSIDDLLVTVARTDDLLERVVESIDSLQSFVLNRSAERQTS